MCVDEDELEARCLIAFSVAIADHFIAAVDAVARALPGVRAAACFDTAFHATLPPAPATYVLPAEWRERWSLRRFGFHGLSHAYAARRAAELLGRASAELRIVSRHVGAGASLAAVTGGRSVDTTMGFTPLEGLVMATRPRSPSTYSCIASRPASARWPRPWTARSPDAAARSSGQPFASGGGHTGRQRP